MISHALVGAGGVLRASQVIDVSMARDVPILHVSDADITPMLVPVPGGHAWVWVVCNLDGSEAHDAYNPAHSHVPALWGRDMSELLPGWEEDYG